MSDQNPGYDRPGKESSQPLLDDDIVQNRFDRRTRHPVSNVVWGLLIGSWVIIFALAASVLRLSGGRFGCQGIQENFWGAYEHVGIQRELPPTYKHVQFTGALKIVPGQGLVREIDPNAVQYVGTPSAEIDQAWKDLIFPLNIFLTKDEAAMMGTDGMGLEPESDLYMVLPQGFHNLHCIDMLRKNLYPDHYKPPTSNATLYRLHLEHCVDALRQQIQCNADMTINKEHWDMHKGTHGGMFADFNNWHVCRDWDAIREWSNRRNAEEDVWEPIAQRLKATGS